MKVRSVLEDNCPLVLKVHGTCSFYYVNSKQLFSMEGRQL